MLLKNERASLELEIVNYEFSREDASMDEYDRNWLQVRCTWVDEDGEIRKDSNACILAQELTEMTAGLKVLQAGIRDAYESDFMEPYFSLSARADGADAFLVEASFYLPNTMDGNDTAEIACRMTAADLKTLVADLDRLCAKFPERKGE